MDLYSVLNKQNLKLSIGSRQQIVKSHTVLTLFHSKLSINDIILTKVFSQKFILAISLRISIKCFDIFDEHQNAKRK
jgi:hypothetical protein